MLFKTESNFAEIIEILKLIPRVLQHNSVNLLADSTEESNEICEDAFVLKIIAQTLVIIQFDQYQNCKDWSEEKVKKGYAQINTMIVKLHAALLCNSTYINSMKQSKALLDHVMILTLLQSQAKAENTERSVDFVNSVLSSSPPTDVKKACLYLLRQTMCSDVTSLLKAYSIYRTFYNEIQADTLELKFYWYPLKAVILNLIHNLDTIKAQEEECDELLL